MNIVAQSAETEGNDIDLLTLPEAKEEVSKLAYYKAESRSFEFGHELADWLEAEQEYLSSRV